MLPSLYRFKINKKNYQDFYSKGRSVESDLLKILFKKSQPDQLTKFVFVVPRKLDKRSSKRNRTRRLLSGGIAQVLPHVNQGYQVMLIAKKILKREKVDDVRPKIMVLFKKAGLVGF